MGSVKTFALFYFAALLLVVVHVDKIDAQRRRPPLCASQFSLANYACGSLPFMQLPPPSSLPPATLSMKSSSNPPPPPTSPTSSPSPPGQGRGRHRHGRGHHHHHRTPSPAEQNCCRWLKELDGECVCDVLVRLPPFLAKPSHKYTLYVNGACVITYSCSGRIVP
ncbi:unnamed protein product [Linum trigynum]|uniref:Bifunctional inhibitor/plant lipid transfer protein/seed storage helical domain-containing protein n=1 Tax=Linum trigynum TaxID=586398 RepID=A0AAV2D1B4_9ROSI